jgi:hypothetical protein
VLTKSSAQAQATSFEAQSAPMVGEDLDVGHLIRLMCGPQPL